MQIEQRRSVRTFDGAPIDRDIIDEIIEAATYAPSPKNRQPWQFLVMDGPSRICAFASCVRRGIQELLRDRQREDIRAALDTVDTMEQAAALLFVLYDSGGVQTHDDGVDWGLRASDIEVVDLMSIGAAIENLLLKATELGIGTLWCGDFLYAYRAMCEFIGAEKPVVALVCLGYSSSRPPMPPRKPLDEVVVGGLDEAPVRS